MIIWNDSPMGPLFGRMYFFQYAGDALPTHSHPDEEQHNLIVIRGLVELEIEGQIVQVGAPGAVINFDSSKEHTIRARHAGSLTLHMYLNGRPNWYDRVPTSGTFPPETEAGSTGVEGGPSSTRPYVGCIR